MTERFGPLDVTERADARERLQLAIEQDVRTAYERYALEPGAVARCLDVPALTVEALTLPMVASFTRVTGGGALASEIAALCGFLVIPVDDVGAMTETDRAALADDIARSGEVSLSGS